MDCRNISEATKMATELYTHATHVPFMAKYVFDLPKINRSKKRQINTVTVIAGRTISSKEKIKNKKKSDRYHLRNITIFLCPVRRVRKRALQLAVDYYHALVNIII